MNITAHKSDLNLPKVYLVPGSMFGSEAPGWFRISFAVGEDKLVEGLARVARAVQGNNGT